MSELEQMNTKLGVTGHNCIWNFPHRQAENKEKWPKADYIPNLPTLTF